MADATWIPTHWNGVDLTASPFKTTGLGGQRACFFMAANSPLKTQEISPVEAAVVRKGDADVRGQPGGSTWDLHCLLEDATDAIKEDFYKIFDEEQDDTLYLRCDDSTSGATNHRIAGRIEGIRRHPGRVDYFIVTVRMANAVFEGNAETTTEGNLNNMSGDSASQAVVNGGNRRVLPKYELTPISARAANYSATDPLFVKDFTRFRRGIVVNRSPDFWNNLPVNLVEVQSLIGTAVGGSVWDTSAEVRDTTFQNRMTSAMGAGDTTSQTIDTPVGGGLQDGIGWCWIDAKGGGGVEQIRYPSITGSTTMDGTLRRGIGGTTDGAHETNTDCHQSHMLADCKDVRVYANGKEIERWVGQPNTANTRVYSNFTLPPTVRMIPLVRRNDNGTLTISSTDPANGGVLQFPDGVDGLPDSGLFQIERETLSYSGRNVAKKQVTGIQRAVWAFAHSEFNAANHNSLRQCYFNVVPYIIAWEREEAAWNQPAPEPDERKPAIQLDSTNILWKYGDQATIAGSSFLNLANPGRAGGFILDHQLPAEDVNGIRPLTLKTSDDDLGWTTGDVEGRPSVGRVTLHLPMRLSQASGAVVVDIGSRLYHRMRILLRDRAGTEEELANYHNAQDSSQVFTPGVETAQSFDPKLIGADISLEAVRAVICGNYPKHSLVSVALNDVPTVSSGNRSLLAQKVVLDQDAYVEGVWLQMSETTGVFTYAVKLFDNSSPAAPDAGIVVAHFAGPNEDTNADTTTGIQDFYLTGEGGQSHETYRPRRIAAGTYWLAVLVETLSSGSLNIRVGPVETKHNQYYTDDPGSAGGFQKDGLGIRFALMHASAGPVQISALDFDDDGTSGTFDKLILKLNTVFPSGGGNDGEVIGVDLSAGLTTGYHTNGVLKNTTTGEQITVDAFMKLGLTLTIDTALRKVFLTEGNWQWDIPGAIIPTNFADWLALAADSNTIQWDEDNMVDTDLKVLHRDRKV